MQLVLLGLLAVGAPGVEQLKLRGQIVCLDAARQPVDCGDAAASGPYALRDDDGHVHHFQSEDTRVPIFDDPRVRRRRLEVHVWKRDGKLEIIKVYSLVDGQLHLPHYFCDVCTITAYTGGDCWCCQQEFEFRETLVQP